MVIQLDDNILSITRATNDGFGSRDKKDTQDKQRQQFISQGPPCLSIRNRVRAPRSGHSYRYSLILPLLITPPFVILMHDGVQ